jgi:hypothetical protein
MTPVARIGGLAGGQMVAAVQFHPNDLRLLRPLTLTFDVPAQSGLEGFSSADNGRKFDLYPLKFVAGKATLTLFHFTTYGVAEKLPPPSEVTLRKRLETIVKPAVASPIRDPSDFAFVALIYSSWKTEVDKLAAGKRATFAADVAALEQSLASSLRSLADDQHTSCVDKDNVLETGRQILKLIDTAGTIPASGDSLFEAASYAALQRSKCERFELDFDSTITSSAPQGSGSSFRIVETRSVVEMHGLKLNPGNSWTNQMLPKYVSYTPAPAGVNTGCSTSLDHLSATAPFKAKLDPVSDWYAEPGDAPLISMDVDVGRVLEFVRLVCPGVDIVETSSDFTYGMAALHQGVLHWTIGEWSYVGGVVFAQRTYADTVAGAGSHFTEKTTFTLRHTPAN